MTTSAGTTSPETTSPETTSSAKSLRSAPPRFRPARFEDYAQISQLVEASGLESQPESDWRSVWLDNPLWAKLADRWPIGWVLEDSGGRIVGSIMNVPSRYMFKGRELLCANGRAWVASPEYRGISLMLMDEYFNQEGADIFINTTVGPMALKILDELAVRVPIGEWESIAYWITGHRGFARQAMKKLRIPKPDLLAAPAGAVLKLKDAIMGKSLPEAPASVDVSLIPDFDSRFDDFWNELLTQNRHKLLAVRDRAALAWHFAIPLRRGRLRILTACRNGALRAYCVLKRHDQEGGFTRMRLVDYQTIDSEIDLLPSLLRVALGKCAQEGIDIMDHLGCGLPKMRAVDEFAPYRHKVASWPFYYRANDPALCSELVQPKVWDPSSYDGDASFE